MEEVAVANGCSTLPSDVTTGDSNVEEINGVAQAVKTEGCEETKDIPEVVKTEGGEEAKDIPEVVKTEGGEETKDIPEAVKTEGDEDTKDIPEEKQGSSVEVIVEDDHGSKEVAGEVAAEQLVEQNDVEEVAEEDKDVHGNEGEESKDVEMVEAVNAKVSVGKIAAELSEGGSEKEENMKADDKIEVEGTEKTDVPTEEDEEKGEKLEVVGEGKQDEKEGAEESGTAAGEKSEGIEGAGEKGVEQPEIEGVEEGGGREKDEEIEGAEEKEAEQPGKEDCVEERAIEQKDEIEGVEEQGTGQKYEKEGTEETGVGITDEQIGETEEKGADQQYEKEGAEETGAGITDEQIGETEEKGTLHSEKEEGTEDRDARQEEEREGVEQKETEQPEKEGEQQQKKRKEEKVGSQEDNMEEDHEVRDEVPKKKDRERDEKDQDDNTERTPRKKARSSRERVPRKDDKQDGSGSGSGEPKELASPPSVYALDRPVRQRKSVERLVEVIENESNKKFVIEKGRGIPLKDVPNVAHRLARKKPEDIKLIHLTLFGRKGKSTDFKNHILQYSGFVWHESDEKQMAKTKERLDKYSKDVLLDLCDLFGIPTSKVNLKKDDLVPKLLDFIAAPQVTTDVSSKEQSSSSRKRKKSTDGSSTRSNDGTSKRPRRNIDDEDGDGDDDEDQEQFEMDEKFGGDEGSDEDGYHSGKQNPKKSLKANKGVSKASSEDVDSPDGSAKVFSRKRKSSLTPKQTPSLEKETKEKQSSGKRANRGRGKPTDAEPGPSKEELKKTINSIIKKLDLNAVTFSDIVKMLGAHYKMDMTPQREALKPLVHEELTKLAEQSDEDEDGTERDANVEPQAPVAAQ